MNQGGQRVTNLPPNMFGKQQYTANIDIVAVECIEINEIIVNSVDAF